MKRFRVLLGRKVTVLVNVKTENAVGAKETESSVKVEGFRNSKKVTGGKVEICGEKNEYTAPEKEVEKSDEQ